MRNRFSKGYSFSPVEIPGCALWLEADRGITLDGSSNVSAWADQSGNGRNVSQATANKRPAYVASGMNGRPILRTTTTTFLNNVSISGLNALAGFTVFLVTSPTDPTANGFALNFNSSSGNMTLRTAGSRWYIETDENAPNRGYDTTVLLALPTLITGIFNGAGIDNATRLKMMNNGNQRTLTFQGTIPALLANLTILEINALGSGNGLVADYAAIIIYPRTLTTAERQRVEAYLGRKYGITLA